jgi:hypothetical protein
MLVEIIVSIPVVSSIVIFVWDGSTGWGEIRICSD